MTHESMSTQHVNLAERFSSFADYAASTASLPQTAATSLDVARFHAFTGELTFSVDPSVRLYLDGGNVYHAECEGDRPVSRLLLDAGVIDPTQLQRGVVTVGEVEHLGRLFDRDASIDRDAVMVVLESATEVLLQQIANSVIASVTATAYRHHPSGIHRWFVAPAEPTRVQRPASGVMQVDRSVVEELPRLDGGPSGLADGAGPGTSPLRIDWTDPAQSSGGSADNASAGTPNATAGMDIDIEAELDRFDADRADWSAGSTGDQSESVSSLLGEFRIVWPDGTEDATLVDTATTADPADDVIPTSPIAPPAPLSPDPAPTPPPAPFAAPLPTSAPTDAPPSPAAFAPPAPVTPPAATDAQPAPMGFTMKPLQVDRLPEPDSAVPDGVAAAVRRALQAIENATAAPTNAAVPELHLTPVALPEWSTPRPSAAPPVAPGVEPAITPTAPPPPEQPQPLGFAPPTMATSAEAVYRRAASEAAPPVAAAAISTSSPQPDAAPTPVADVGQDAAEQRRGALQRLIGSLRNND